MQKYATRLKKTIHPFSRASSSSDNNASLVSARSMSAVRVVSYNVLCSHLAPADRFCHCKPNDLAAPVRLKRILKALDVEVAAGSVLCLQEVGREWSGELHKYFSDKGFHFIHSGYGEPYNDYMGSFCDSNNSTSNYDLHLFSKLFCFLGQCQANHRLHGSNLSYTKRA